MHTYYALMAAALLSLIGISMNQAHFLSTLLSLETMTLILFLLMALPPLCWTNMVLTPMLMMSMCACEAGAGLTLMTVTTRKHANDQLANLNLLKC
uniref:NADH-ubiquinone oxidoreductase chain 4L n=1 Tax=Pseudotrapelus sinaitus TaxID=118229 RepID=D1MV82_9SAUR|nr:NADH dehydrogenase subunit 4L [Pseudotrapelus sinaitus]BAI52996.1 NADH dehydrogenase subunit 4L [Pseudotrapelus sinaitus]